MKKHKISLLMAISFVVSIFMPIDSAQGQGPLPLHSHSYSYWYTRFKVIKIKRLPARPNQAYSINATAVQSHFDQQARNAQDPTD